MYKFNTKSLFIESGSKNENNRKDDKIMNKKIVQKLKTVQEVETMKNKDTINNAHRIITDILKLPFKEWMAHYPEDYFSVVKALAYGKPDLTDEQCSVKSFTTAEIFKYLFNRKQELEEDHIVITDSYMETLIDCTYRIVKPVAYYLRTKDASAEVDKLLCRLLADVTYEDTEQLITYSLALLEVLCKAASNFVH